METKERLSAWLHSKSKDYQEGVSIFREISHDKKMIGYFTQKNPQRIHISILEMKLRNYARINQIHAESVPEKKPEISTKKISQVQEKEKQANVLPQIQNESDQPVIQRPKVDKNPVVRYEDLPEQLQVLYDQNGKMYSEMKAFHAEIKQLKDRDNEKERRGVLADEILKREKAIRENWDVIDAWWKKHLEADPLKQAAEDALAKDRRIKADLAYIRRFLGKAKAQEEVELRMKELDKWGVDYENLRKHWDGSWS